MTTESELEGTDLLTVEHIETYGWESAVRGMRNPMNSWDKSDTTYQPDGFCVLGHSDLKLMRRLIEAGPDHAKFLRMIGISMDITAPLYWWPEFDTYKVGTVRNSCSKMHKIHSKRFTLDDFSTEHLDPGSMNVMKTVVKSLEHWRMAYNQPTKNKEDWWQMIQLLPSSYNQKATVTLNYEVARRMYHARKNHKLDEWHTLCDALMNLPYAGTLIMG